ncbi:basic proline-rich protein-like [Panicum virgatum]|uniref:basic proline-rich protein-like n=1 Tax=Panicum virgatum TaxID=38727 RepID=UPI0019D51A5C|nr:basic proline-rich protein-like [Panicum virgatum]
MARRPAEQGSRPPAAGLAAARAGSAGPHERRRCRAPSLPSSPSLLSMRRRGVRGAPRRRSPREGEPLPAPAAAPARRGPCSELRRPCSEAQRRPRTGARAARGGGGPHGPAGRGRAASAGTPPPPSSHAGRAHPSSSLPPPPASAQAWAASPPRPRARPSPVRTAASGLMEAAA